MNEDLQPSTPPEGQDETDRFFVQEGSLRRRPKYGAFGVIGGLLGLLIGLILAQTGIIPSDENYSRTDLSIVLVGLGVPAGILIFLLIALLFDRKKK